MTYAKESGQWKLAVYGAQVKKRILRGVAALAIQRFDYRLGIPPDQVMERLEWAVEISKTRSLWHSEAERAAVIQMRVSKWLRRGFDPGELNSS